MKKALFTLLALCLILTLTACAQSVSVTQTFDTGYKPYEKLSDGTYRCEGQIYKYRLEISGRMPNAAKDSTFVYLSNLESISFEKAWKASGLSSDLNDYFKKEEATLVELN